RSARQIHVRCQLAAVRFLAAACAHQEPAHLVHAPAAHGSSPGGSSSISRTPASILERDLAQRVALGIVEAELLPLALGVERECDGPERRHQNRARTAAERRFRGKPSQQRRRRAADGERDRPGAWIHSAPYYSLTSPRAKIEATKFKTSVAQISQYP